MTDKGKTAVEVAIPAGWEFIHKVVSRLSYDDQHALADMLETVKCELVGYLNPETDAAEITAASLTKDPDLYKRMARNLLPCNYKTERNGRKK